MFQRWILHEIQVQVINQHKELEQVQRKAEIRNRPMGGSTDLTSIEQGKQLMLQLWKVSTSGSRKQPMSILLDNWPGTPVQNQGSAKCRCLTKSVFTYFL